MGRWEPGARDRLQQAALTLYAERGFEHTTVAEIAAEAGLTERTYFRHFADKREVLFSGTEELQERLERAVAGAPASAGPLDAVAAALAAISAGFEDGRERARQRQAVIATTAGLRERELVKLAALAAAMADALRRRGVAEPAASVVAEAGIAVFRVAFDRWVAEGEQRPLTEVVRAALEELRAISAA